MHSNADFACLPAGEPAPGKLSSAGKHLYSTEQAAVCPVKEAVMAIQKTERIWHNGKLIPWDEAQLHVMSHVVNYGSSVFEGIRCYAQPKGPAIFRAQEHMQRLLDSAKVYRMEVEYTRDELVNAMIELISVNHTSPCYIRPLVLRGYGEAGVNPFNSPVEVYIVNYPWGKYLGHGDEGRMGERHRLRVHGRAGGELHQAEIAGRRRPAEPRRQRVQVGGERIAAEIVRERVAPRAQLGELGAVCAIIGD